MGDHHLFRPHHHPRIAQANGDLAAQGLVAGTVQVGKGRAGLETGDLGQLLVQGPQRQIVGLGHRHAQGHHAFPP